MPSLTPIESLNFFENHLPQFLSRNKSKVEKLVSDLKTALKKEKSESFHASILDKGKALTKHIVEESTRVLSDKYKSPRANSDDLHWKCSPLCSELIGHCQAKIRKEVMKNGL